jgi:epoxyqueuosine reductase
MSLNLLVKERALAAGFDIAGVAPLSVWADLAFARAWVERGYAGEMAYLANPKRDDPRLVLPSAKSVICVGLIYNSPFPYSTETARTRVQANEDAERAGPGTAWISRYAWGRDYHEIMRAKMEELCKHIDGLAPGVETRAYADTGPLVERAFARYSGIGWTGKNTCLINQQKGSWFFIGVILTSLELEPDLPAADRCGSCTRCIDACPTGALVQPYVMDGSRCIAYFTIELKGSIPVGFRQALGSNVFGCDICQDICPWNSQESTQSYIQEPSAITQHEAEQIGGPGGGVDKLRKDSYSEPQQGLVSAEVGRRFRPAVSTTVPEFQPLQVGQENFRFSLFNPSLQDLTSITEEDFRRWFTHSPLKRPKYHGWLRNLCVVIGNSGDLRFVPWLERMCQYPDELVREHAAWALAQINRQHQVSVDRS